MSGYKFHKQTINSGRIPCSLFFVLFCCNNLLASEVSLNLDHDNVRWTRLVYEASAFFVTLDTEIKLHVVGVDTALSELVLNDKTNVVAPEGENLFRIDTLADGFGKKTEYQLWFGQNGEALQRKKIVRGKKNEIKIYRYSDCGYYSLRQKFSNKKFDENFNQWDESNTSFSPFPPNLCGDQGIYDVNELLYLISAMNIQSAGYQQEVLTFSKGRLVKVKITAKKMTSIYSQFQVKSASGKEEIEDKVDVMQVTVAPITNDKKEKEDFKFLGLTGNVKLYIDTKRQLILRLSGDVDVLGSIDINLKKAELVR